MPYIILIALLIAAIVRPRSRTIAVLLLAFMWVIYAFNTYSGDFVAYRDAYNIIEELGFHYEPFFTIIMLGCHRLGLSFTGFRMVLATLFILILAFTIIKHTEQVALVVALFCLGPFFFFASVLRAGIAGLIIVNACASLNDRSYRGTARFLIMLGLAVMFHYTSIVFIVILFEKYIPKSAILIFVICSSLIVFVVLQHGESLINWLALYTDREKTFEWFYLLIRGSTLNWLGKLTAVAVVVGNAIITYYLRYNYEMKLKAALTEPSYNKELIYIAEKLTFIMLAMSPFVAVSDVLLRFVWEIQLLVIIAAVNVIDAESTNRLFTKRMSVDELTFILWTAFVFVKIDNLNNIISFIQNNSVLLRFIS